MFQVHDNFTLKVKRISKDVRSLIIAIGAGCLLLSTLYGLYWSLATNGDIVIEYTQQYYSPLVGLFFDDVDLLENYLTMSKYLFLAIVPCIIVHYMVQKTEEIVICLHQKKIKMLDNRRLVKEAIEEEKEYTNIKSYSVCISFDFSQNKNLSSDFKLKFNKYFAKTLKKKLSEISDKIQLTLSKVILIYADDFDLYDEIYSVVSSEVNSAKSLLGEKISVIPTITVDAYTREFDPYSAIKQHFDIVKCNLNGKATTTSIFRKKYTHINKSKYAGIPIGLYTTSHGENYDEYDLNIIQKLK